MAGKHPRPTPRSRGGRRYWAMVIALWAGCVVFAWPQPASAAITNVIPVNVTPTGFSIFWRAPDSTPSIAVFADSGGATNLAGKVCVETFPLHTGDPDRAAGYDRRQSRTLIRQQTKSMGLMLVRVTECQPNTTYYYRLTSTPQVGNPLVYPPSGPLPSVTTARENSFVIDDEVLILDVAGLNSLGRIVTLSNANTAYVLAAVVGDGVGTNQVFFNAADFFAAAGGANFAPIGAQQFTADLLGASGQGDALAQLTLTFGTNFVTALPTRLSFGREFLAISIGSAVLRTGQGTNVALGFNSSAAVADLSLAVDIPPGHLSNLALQSLAPEIDPLSATVTAQGQTTEILHLAPRTGQTITGSKQVAQLAFTAISNQHSAFVSLTLRQITATKPDATLVANLFGQSGRAVVIGPEALLEANLGPSGSRSLTLYGNPLSSYAIEYATDLTSPISWTRLPYRIPLTTLSAQVPGLEPAPSDVFYRAVEFFADPPLLDGALLPDGTGQLTIYGQPGSSYLLQYTDVLGVPTTWSTLTQVTLTTPFTMVQVTNPSSGARFYRVIKVVGPSLSASLNPDRTGRLLISGQPGRRYTVEYNTNLSDLTGWYPLQDVNLTATTASINVTNTAGSIFFRLRQN